ncbi:hypothetical protein HDA40_000575 [Hamadaea flava]|uniref:Diiron oxygenase n=1 Tax=Hamadaea flava TaxID=1742688 RepID=A0ABV8M113_9ACTN|nr:diiron oxygenase [Hamadaea flava]MCP2322068.1 hypothetical protein [Hamadaea flava]
MSALATALAEVAPTAERLSRLSERAFQNPYTTVDWPSTVEPEADWFTSPEYVSLYGTDVWPGLDEKARKRLAFHEAAGFYSLNIHGEKSLMQGLAARLYRSDLAAFTGYLHHFLDEENKHSVYFGGFCTRYARVHRTRQLPFATERPRDVDDFLFFAKTMIFEEIVDHCNRIQARDRRLHPLARFINDSHHRDEARHLAFGRQLTAALWAAAAPGWEPAVIDEIRADLHRFLAASWRDYYHPDVYADAGFAEPWELADLAWCTPAQREHRRRVSAKCLRVLTAAGVLTEEPSDAF